LPSRDSFDVKEKRRSEKRKEKEEQVKNREGWVRLRIGSSDVKDCPIPSDLTLSVF